MKYSQHGLSFGLEAQTILILKPLPSPTPPFSLNGLGFWWGMLGFEYIKLLDLGKFRMFVFFLCGLMFAETVFILVEVVQHSLFVKPRHSFSAKKGKQTTCLVASKTWNWNCGFLGFVRSPSEQRPFRNVSWETTHLRRACCLRPLDTDLCLLLWNEGLGPARVSDYPHFLAKEKLSYPEITWATLSLI